MVGNAQEFHSGRQFAAWLGLVPGQYSSGGKARLGRITKAGDAYLRSLLVLGARAVLNAARSKTDSLSRWALAVAERRGYWKAVVAIAAKNARMAWAVLTKGEVVQAAGLRSRCDEPPALVGTAFASPPTPCRRDQTQFPPPRDDPALMCKGWTCAGSDRSCRGASGAPATARQTRLTNGSPARVFHQGPQPTATASMTGCSFSSPHPLPTSSTPSRASKRRMDDSRSKPNSMHESLRDSITASVLLDKRGSPCSST